MSNAVFQLRYLVIPDFAFKDAKLTLIDLKVYGFIHAYTNPFYFSNDQIAEMFNCHPQTVSTSIKHLEELSYILTKYKNKSGGGKVRLSLDAHLDSVYRLSGSKEIEAATQSAHSEKDIKDNLLKGGTDELNTFKKPIRREDKVPKVRAWGSSGDGSYYRNNSQSNPPRREKGWADGRHIR